MLLCPAQSTKDFGENKRPLINALKTSQGRNNKAKRPEQDQLVLVVNLPLKRGFRILSAHRARMPSLNRTLVKNIAYDVCFLSNAQRLIDGWIKKSSIDFEMLMGNS